MWGMHLTVDVANCNANRSDAGAIARFAKDMVERIGMTAYGEPWIVHFAKENPQSRRLYPDAADRNVEHNRSLL